MKAKQVVILTPSAGIKFAHNNTNKDEDERSGNLEGEGSGGESEGGDEK
jgi:hypothetical protein